MAVDVPDYLNAAPAPAVPGAPVPASSAGDLPAVSAASFVAMPDEVKPDWRATWLARIAAIRAADDRFRAAHLALADRDDRLARVIACWPLVAPPFELPLEGEPDQSDQQVLQRCWSKQFNPGKANDPFVGLVGASCGLTFLEAKTALMVAVQARLIYPDGELSAGAQAFVNASAAAALIARRPRQKSTAPPAPAPQA
jgi:hypothetical protein